jgi:hypothetical protein
MIETDDHPSHWIPEHMLIASVITLSVKDACLEPLKSPLAMQWDAMTAHDFLWGEGLESYIHWLDIDCAFYRRKLIETMANDREDKVNGFTGTERRAFRWNKKTWDRESPGLGGRMARDSSSHWESMEPATRKEQPRVTQTARRYSNGIEALVQYHQTDSGK